MTNSIKFAPKVVGIAHVKPMYLVSLITALGCPVDFANLRTRTSAPHRIYSVLVLLLYVAASAISLYARAVLSYNHFTETNVFMDVVDHLLNSVSSIYSVLNQIFYLRKNLEKYFALVKRVDGYLSPTEDVNDQRYSFKVFLVSHVLFVILFSYDYFSWSGIAPFWHWCLYLHRLYCYYLNLVMVLQFYTFSSALSGRFRLVNKEIMKLSKKWSDSKDLKVVNNIFNKFNHGGVTLSNIIKSHDMLCDSLELVNDIYGFNLMFLFSGTVIIILLCFNMIITIALELQTTSHFGHYIILLASLWGVWYLVIGIVITKFCRKASSEACKTASIAYKLIHCIPVDTMNIEDNNMRKELYLLARQVAYRKPVFDAAGFFVIDYPMLFSVLGAVTSYFVIIIQFNTSTIFASNT